ncbi:hypothetical protein IWX75_000542 [Arthrobacter sp. CAN_A6]|uniref:hypothetical protein n=1 Tax=Arthrobacter sp. CAN_A6 TaxID=2787721 RepID=UPI0018CA600A
MKNPSLVSHCPNPDSVAESMLSWAPSPWEASGFESAGRGTKTFPADISEVSTRRLRVLCNRIYGLLNSDHPPLEAREQYEVLVEELECRKTTAKTRVRNPVAARQRRRFDLLHAAHARIGRADG